MALRLSRAHNESQRMCGNDTPQARVAGGETLAFAKARLRLAVERDHEP